MDRRRPAELHSADRVPPPTIASGGWVLPGFVDAHATSVWPRTGWVPDAEGQVAQATLDRDAGALLLRDAGSPVDNTAVQRRGPTCPG